MFKNCFHLFALNFNVLINKISECQDIASEDGRLYMHKQNADFLVLWIYDMDIISHDAATNVLYT